MNKISVAVTLVSSVSSISSTDWAIVRAARQKEPEVFDFNEEKRKLRGRRGSNAKKFGNNRGTKPAKHGQKSSTTT
jgi:hypothetical protein